MPDSTLLRDGALRVYDYRCTAGPADPPYTEEHSGYSLAYVRRGSFGYTARGRTHEVVAGGFIFGSPGDEFVCTHEHHAGGDECLSYHFDAGALDALGVPTLGWGSGALPVLPRLSLLGERAQAAVCGDSDLGLDEAGAALAAAFVGTLAGTGLAPLKVSARDRRRAVRAALWLEAHCAEQVSLERVARGSGVSVFHFLRLFTRVTGVTPHQFLVRSRLRQAARRLAQGPEPIAAIAFDVGFGDLSNFVRTFSRAAGVTPGAFRRATRQERKILQDRLTGPDLR